MVGGGEGRGKYFVLAACCEYLSNSLRLHIIAECYLSIFVECMLHEFGCDSSGQRCGQSILFNERMQPSKIN